MRLWHEKLIPYLPRQQLLGQHRECCALRGNGWGKRHSVVNYVFEYTPEQLFRYHEAIMEEMQKRGYNVDSAWKDPHYRGKICEPHNQESFKSGKMAIPGVRFYAEHTEDYLDECIQNLSEKGINIEFDEEEK
ncbi:TIGR02328 family protein [Aciduricibacillus chroicocephali]|uniref:TIGR02328 family protein n=1 Tax=Aciduricibacillus chroicocephali TaxID=3054939 RepID=A0ABY9KWS0_9BACI|nr:TIGR02328 family protein [Bacillaceae bacterium 44XB]